MNVQRDEEGEGPDGMKFCGVRALQSEGKKPGSGGRFEGQGAPYTILRNEPTVFAENIQCIIQYIKHLRQKILEEIGGFVFQNEPTGGVFWRGERQELGSFLMITDDHKGGS